MTMKSTKLMCDIVCVTTRLDGAGYRRRSASEPARGQGAGGRSNTGASRP